MPFRMFEIPSSGSQAIMCDDELLKMLLTLWKKKVKLWHRPLFNGSKCIKKVKNNDHLKKTRCKEGMESESHTILAHVFFGTWWLIFEHFELVICQIIYLITVWILRRHPRASVSFWRVSMNFWACLSSDLLGGKRPVQSQRSCQPLVSLYLETQSQQFCYSHI